MSALAPEDASATPPRDGTGRGSAEALPAGPRPGAVATRSAVHSLGAFLPEGVLDNAELERLVDTSDRWILERTGIRQRRRAGAGETASVMGAVAGRRALDRAGTASPDAIIVATCSPDTLVPATACLVQRRLGLPGVPAFDVGAACSGFMYGLSVADAMVRAGTATTVLLIAAEAMTTLVDYTDRGTCVLFGDGAGAAVIGPASEGGVLSVRLGADGREADLIYYGPRSEGDADAVRMAGGGTFKLAVERLGALALELCADADWHIDDVDLVVPHQANLRIVEAAARRLGVSMDRVMWNGDRLGNTSAASIPLALEEAERTGRLHPGDRVLCLAFGAGATWGGAAMRWGQRAA